MKKPTVKLRINKQIASEVVKKFRTYNISYDFAYTKKDVQRLNGMVDVILFRNPMPGISYIHSGNDADYVLKVIFEQLGWSNPF
jgi:hypothetical protein